MAAAQVIRVLVETTSKKVFVSALEWPGLSRAAKDEALAIEALMTAVPRYLAVARRAGIPFDTDVAVEAVEHAPGNATTSFGAPAIIAEADRRPGDAAEAEGLAALVGASWAVFDEVAATAPEELRKGPRGGGRDRTRIVGHVTDAEKAYAAQIGIKLEQGRQPRRHPSRDHRGSRDTLGWHADRRAQVDAALRRAADRVARP